MPFKSEKQRRYLWANEPEIARDWSEKYGGRVKKQGGGVMDQIPFMTGFKLPDVWNQWQQHKMASNLMKEDPTTRDYHQLAANDFMQRFPNTPDWLANSLATGYQYGSELGRQFIPVNSKNIYTALPEGIKKGEPMGAIVNSISDALRRAKEESRLGKEGIAGLTEGQQNRYDKFSKSWDPTLKSMYPTNKLSSLKNTIGTKSRAAGQFYRMQKDKRATQQGIAQAAMHQQIQQAEAAAAQQAAAQQVRQNIRTYGNRDRPNTGINRPGGERGRSPTGGDVVGTPFNQGGLVSLWPR